MHFEHKKLTGKELFGSSKGLLAVRESILKKHVKGIVSRDWGELQMIPMDKSEVFSSARSYFFLL